MANEILLAGLGNETLTTLLSQEMLLLLADRNALPSHPALFRQPWVGGPSMAVKVPIVGLPGYDLLAAVSEDTDPGNTAWTDSVATVTAAQKAKIYEASDIARIVAGGIFNPAALALDAVVSAQATMLSTIANLVDNFATTVGSSGVNATVANFLAAKAALAIAGVQGQLLCILHPRQWADILDDLALASGGAAQFLPGNEALLSRSQSLGYQGVFFGVDVWTTLFVPTANSGADRAGGMFGRGALIDMIADPPDTMGLPTIANVGMTQFEIVRAGETGMTRFKSSIWYGATEGIDTAGVSIITDA